MDVVDDSKFFQTMVDLGYNKETYTYTAGCVDRANLYINFFGYSREKAVKASLMSEGLYCPNDL